MRREEHRRERVQEKGGKKKKEVKNKRWEGEGKGGAERREGRGQEEFSQLVPKDPSLVALVHQSLSMLPFDKAHEAHVCHGSYMSTYSKTGKHMAPTVIFWLHP